MHATLRLLSFAFILLAMSLCAQAQSAQKCAHELESMGAPMFENNSVQILSTGVGKYEELFADIREAKRYVHMDYFKFQQDSICMELFGLLAAKARQGVEVRIIFDALGNKDCQQPLTKKFLRQLRADGIQIEAFDPVRLPWVNHLLHRDHHKIAVIDGLMAYSGGMNIADYYLFGKPRVGMWRDMHMKLRGPVVDGYEHLFEVMWFDVSGQLLPPAQYRAQHAQEGHVPIALVDRQPYGTPAIMRNAYASAIDNAQSDIQIINPYATLTRTVRRALYSALRRGVRVQIMASLSSDVSVTPDVVAQEMRRLMKRGAEVYYFTGGFHHSKVMMVDGTFCTIGTANLDGRSLCFDYEVNGFIFDADVTRQLQDIFEQDVAQASVRLTPDNWKELFSPRQRFAGRFFRPIKGAL